MEDDDLLEGLLDHARNVATNEEERGWAKFEALKLVGASNDSFLRLAEEAEAIEGAQALAAAVHHYVALVQLAQGQMDEARAIAQCALRLTGGQRSGRNGVWNGAFDEHCKASTR